MMDTAAVYVYCSEAHIAYMFFLLFKKRYHKMSSNYYKLNYYICESDSHPYESYSSKSLKANVLQYQVNK